MMRMEYVAEYSTPFNSDKNSLKGTVEFPFYWPNGKEAELLSSRIAMDSLAGVGAAIPDPKRKTATKPSAKDN